MDEKRRNEIAFALFREHQKCRGISVGEDYRAFVAYQAKQTGLPFEEVLEFYTTLTGQLLTEVAAVGTPASKEELEGHHRGHGGAH